MQYSAIHIGCSRAIDQNLIYGSAWVARYSCSLIAGRHSPVVARQSLPQFSQQAQLFNSSRNAGPEVLQRAHRLKSFGGWQCGCDQSDLPDVIIQQKVMSAYFAEKMITKYVTKKSNNCAKCACIRNTNVCFFQCMQASQVGQHFNLLPNFEL